MKGHLRKRGPNTYAAVIELGRDASGKRRQKWITLHGTKKMCEAELTRLVHELNTGMYAEPDRILTRDYFKRWLEDHVQASVAPRTYERYVEIINLHLVPALGHIPLQKLRPLHIQTMEAEMLRSGCKRRCKHIVEDNEDSSLDPPRGLSARTVLHHHRVLHTALEQAVKWQLLARNPADAVRPPRLERREVTALEDEETVRLLRAAQGTRLYLPILLAATTGMRRGKLLGFRWQDVDIAGERVWIRQALSSTNGGLVFRQPKTNKSRRQITLLRLTVSALKEHRRVQTSERLRLGPVWRDHGLVCPAEDGSPWHPDTFTSAWRKLAADNAFSHCGFHSLRHTHATQLLKQGIHPKIVSERLGHSTIGLTLDTYSHLLPGMQESAAKKLDAALRKALATKSNS